MHIGIVADGGYEKGMGHVVRMKRLADELKQCCLITFYTNQESEPFLHEEHWHVIVKPELQQHEFILREIKSKKLDLLLFDILGAPVELLTKIKAETDAKIVLLKRKTPKRFIKATQSSTEFTAISEARCTIRETPASMKGRIILFFTLPSKLQEMITHLRKNAAISLLH